MSLFRKFPRDWLVHLADPQRLSPRPAGDPPWRAAAALLASARDHGVLPAALRNMAREAPASDAGLGQILTEARAQFAGAAAFGLLLSHHGDRAFAAMRERGVRLCNVKGPVFARRAYPDPGLRTFTDRDMLIHDDDRAAAGAVLAELGFVHEDTAFLRGDHDFSEEKWFLAGQKQVMIELHTDLVHSDRLRRVMRLGHDAVLAAGGGDPEHAHALLLVAAIHGATSHQFDRLQHVVDVLLLGRGAAGPIDARGLGASADRCGARFALASALAIAASTFSDPSCARLAADLTDSSRIGLARALIGPGAVIVTQRASAALRRSLYRKLLRAS